MSRHHENVRWQSPDGTWNAGFFERIPCRGSDCDDETHEWCDEFNRGAFEWVSTGHSAEQAADRSWTGPNPGGTDGGGPYDPNDPHSVARSARYDDLAAVAYENRDGRTWMEGRYVSYYGPPKQRTLTAIQAEREQMVRDWIGHRLGGYANQKDPREEGLAAQITERLKTATPEEIADYEQRSTAHRDQMREMLAKHREDRTVRARQRRPYGSHYYDPNFAQRERDLDAREEEVEAYIAKADDSAKKRAAARRPAKAPAKKTAPKKTTATKTTAARQTKKPAAPPAGGAQGRVQAGVPAGGQFTTSARTEAQVALAAPVDPAASSDPWA